MGTEKIPLSKKDLAEIKKIEKPGLKLLGFKDESFLKPYHNMTHSYFLACDENVLKFPYFRKLLALRLFSLL